MGDIHRADQILLEHISLVMYNGGEVRDVKLVFAIIHHDDVSYVENKLSMEKFRITKIASTGGFLRSGNTTFLIGVEDDRYERVLEIIRENTKPHKALINSVTKMDTESGVSAMNPVQVKVGGATIFVVSVEHYEHL